jgi:uncharacterized protein
MKDFHMKCPTCPDTNLTLSARDGVEIDYCPNCRGVWLDRGELDKIIERANGHTGAQKANSDYNREQRDSRPDFADSDFSQGRNHPPGKHKKSWLNQIFD